MKRARNRRKSFLTPAIAAALLLSAAACSEPHADNAASGTAAADTERAFEAAEVARRIRADPGSREQVLADAGITWRDYEGLLYEIAADPDLSEAYARRLEESPEQPD